MIKLLYAEKGFLSIKNGEKKKSFEIGVKTLAKEREIVYNIR